MCAVICVAQMKRENVNECDRETWREWYRFAIANAMPPILIGWRDCEQNKICTNATHFTVDSEFCMENVSANCATFLRCNSFIHSFASFARKFIIYTAHHIATHIWHIWWPIFHSIWMQRADTLIDDSEPIQNSLHRITTTTRTGCFCGINFNYFRFRSIVFTCQNDLKRL